MNSIFGKMLLTKFFVRFTISTITFGKFNTNTLIQRGGGTGPMMPGNRAYE